MVVPRLLPPLLPHTVVLRYRRTGPTSHERNQQQLCEYIVNRVALKNICVDPAPLPTQRRIVKAISQHHETPRDELSHYSYDSSHR